MSDTIGRAGAPVPPTGEARAGAVTEAYAFACLHCGHGWEQAYEIEHHTDASGHPFVTYVTDGEPVPSPLTRPTCKNCDGHLVRIMRSGQVSGIAACRHLARTRPVVRAEQTPHRTHHWSVLNFLHHRHDEA